MVVTAIRANSLSLADFLFQNFIYITQGIDKKLIPKTECLKDTVSRVIPYWQNVIVPEIKVRETQL